MTAPQLARWRSRISKADEQIMNLRALLESLFEVCPEGAPEPNETKEEECERLAAQCVRDAIGALEGMKHALTEAWTHMDWERNKEVREFPIKAREFLASALGDLPEDKRDEAKALLAMGRRKR